MTELSFFWVNYPFKFPTQTNSSVLRQNERCDKIYTSRCHYKIQHHLITGYP